MTQETNIKTLGLKHARKAEQLEYLEKAGLRSIKFTPFSEDKYTIDILRRYKTGGVVVDFSAPTLCEAIEKAYNELKNE